jgi:hypothetical protein
MVRKAEKKPKTGRPSLGLSASLNTHITPETKDWLTEHIRKSGLREGDIVRRILNDARIRGWKP